MAQTALIALNTARTLLNDDGAQLWTDLALIPKLQQAHRELQVQMRANACPITRTTTIATVNANATVFQNPPTNLLEPITLWEKDPAESDSQYVRMTEYDPLPIVAPTTRLIWWRWAIEAVEFVGCTTTRSVKLYYKRTMPVPANGSDTLAITDAEFYIAPRVAALAFGSTGNATAASWCTDMANGTINDILIANRGRSRTVGRP